MGADEPPVLPFDFWTAERFRDPWASRNIGFVLRAYRTDPRHRDVYGEHGISQSRLARWLGTEQAVVSTWENGRREVDSLRRNIEIAQKIGIPPELLWFDLPVEYGKRGDTVGRTELEVLRRSIGMTQEEFAKRMGVGRTTVLRWESGKHTPQPYQWPKMAKVLGIARLRLAEILRASSPEEPLRKTGANPMVEVSQSQSIQVDAPELLNSLGWDMQDHTKRRTFFTQAATTVGTVLAIVSSRHADTGPSRLGFDTETLEGLEQTTLGLRRAYRSAGALSLLGASHGTLNLLTEMLPTAGQYEDRLVTAIGQTASLIGVMLTLDLDDFMAGERYLSLAARAGKQAGNNELLAFSLGARAFHAAYSGDPSGGREYADSALKIAARRSSPIMKAWLSAVASEMYALEHDEHTCRKLLDAASDHLEASDDDEPWSGVGVFNAEKLSAYVGGDLMRLGRYREAQQVLHEALDKLDDSLVKHRCTAYIDLAEAYAADGKLDEATHCASNALTLVAITRHSASLRRIEKLYRHIRATDSHAGDLLGDKLIELKVML